MKNKIVLCLISALFVICSCNKSEPDNIEQKSYVDSLYQTIGKRDSLFTFIHLSDTHGTLTTIKPANEYAKAHPYCDFVALTGDVLPTESMTKTISSANVPYLVIPGNHDSWAEGLGQWAFRSDFLNQLGNDVVFGNNTSNYWYRDVYNGDCTLRVIGLDQFELQDFDTPSGLRAIMTQGQVDWFIETLKDSYDVDGIVILIHMGFGNSSKGNRDITNETKFVSSLAKNYNNSYDFYGPDDPYMIPEIVNAYITGENISKTYVKGTAYEKIVETNFEGAHSNFVAYFGGHLHWDEIEYLNDFPNQLQCLVAYAGNGTGSSYNDLVKTSSGEQSYNFNVNSINLRTRELLIERVGARRTVSETIRDTISFKF